MDFNKFQKYRKRDDCCHHDHHNHNLKCESCGSEDINIDNISNSSCSHMKYMVTCNSCHLTRQYYIPIKHVNLISTLCNHSCRSCSSYFCYQENQIDHLFKHFCDFDNFGKYPNCDNFEAIHRPRTDVLFT